MSNVNKAFDPFPETQVEGHTNVQIPTEECKKKMKERPNWSNGVEFLMSCISMSVGLGNIWRFPFTAYENGGGAFVIPYIIVLLLIGRPMYYLEMILGQFTSRSSVQIWDICPLFRGVGIGQIMATICVISYYSALIAITLLYLVISFQSELPWVKCQEDWTGQDNCVDSLQHSNSTKGDVKLQSSSELYFLKNVLKEKLDISDGIGIPDWKLTLTLFCSWIVIFLVIVKGVKSSGKAAYFLALFPYIVLVALLIRAVTLEGALDGIIFFLNPNWKELLNPKVWKEAVVQSLFSLGVGLGAVLMFSSYNKFNHTIYRDAIIVTSIDTVTSLLAGITIFGILGNLAHNLKVKNISDVVKSGTGLAFISYPDAIAKFEILPQLFAVLFFFMLFVLGIGSIVALQSAVVTVICDRFTSLKFWKVALCTSTVGFCAGLLYITPGGQWMLNLIDYYGGTFVIFALAIVEMIGIFWIYGLQNFCDDVEFMTKRKVTIYWRLCWAIITPGLMTIIFIYSMITLKPLTYSGLEYPPLAHVAGWALLILGFLQFPLWACWQIGRKGDCNVKNLAQPSASWGPYDSKSKEEWIKFKEEMKEKRHKLYTLHNINSVKRKLYEVLDKC